MKNWKVSIIIFLALLALIVSEFSDYRIRPDTMTEHHDLEDAMRRHCLEMPEMQGCENHSSSMDHGDHSSMATSEEAFVVNMIPHHQEAVTTARLVLAKGESADLKKLAQRIITAQEKEIAMMREWTEEWHFTMKPTYQDMMGDGTKFQGKVLDTWFLNGMVLHHEGAVQMAEAVLKLNPRKEVADFARDIIRAQSEEITQMKLMLGENMNAIREE